MQLTSLAVTPAAYAPVAPALTLATDSRFVRQLEQRKEPGMRAVLHKTFSRTHATNVTGKGGLAASDELRKEAEQFINGELGDADVVAITESRDQLASSVTVWYRARG